MKSLGLLVRVAFVLVLLALMRSDVRLTTVVVDTQSQEAGRLFTTPVVTIVSGGQLRFGGFVEATVLCEELEQVEVTFSCFIVSLRLS